MFQYAYGISKGIRRFDISSFDNDTLRKYELHQYDLDIELVRDPEAEAGYWQSEEFFNKQLVFDCFKCPKGSPNPQCFRMSLEISGMKSTCFVGVRRADYLWPERINYHGVMPIEYYREVMKLVPRGTEFFIFTDDLDWAIDNLGSDGEIVNVNGPEEKAWDIWLMSLCDHAIVSNSSFHWWSAWLGPDKNGGTVIAPKRWYKDSKVNEECRIVPDRWIRI